MEQKILNLAQKFIGVESVESNKKALDKVLDIAKYELSGFTIEEFERNNKKSILVYKGQTRPKKFRVILNGHLDVVPGQKNKYKAEINGDKMYGVGSLDMKSSVAALIYAYREAANKVKYPLGLQIVTDEEIGGFDGTLHQIQEGVVADFVISGESTNLNIANKAKGVLWVKITADGKTAHGAYPWRGENASWKLISFLEKLRQIYPILEKEGWVTTVNLANIETNNTAFNKVPDKATCWLDIRFVPKDKDKILESIKAIMPEDFSLEVVTNEPSMFVSEGNKYLNLLKASIEKTLGKNINLYGANGSSDARHYAHIGSAGVEFGPIGGNIGSDEEWISIRSLGNYYEILLNFLFSCETI